MHAGLDAANAETIHRAAHRLKNTVAYLGAPTATDATKHVEALSRNGNVAEAAAAIEELSHELDLLKSALTPHRAATVDGSISPG